MPGRFAPVGVEAHDLACIRGGRLVFAGLSFEARPGAMLAVAGPNGSGKSSLLRVIAGLIPPEAGIVRYPGVADGPAPAHFFGHADALKPAHTLRETLRLWALLFAGPTPSRGDLDRAAGEVGLAHALDLPAGMLSAGQRRRAGLARLLLSPRPLWLLDEPTAALDREGEALLGRMIGDHLAAGGTIVAATHQELPRSADAVLTLASAG